MFCVKRTFEKPCPKKQAVWQAGNLLAIRLVIGIVPAKQAGKLPKQTIFKECLTMKQQQIWRGWGLLAILMLLVACGGSQGSEPAAVPPASEGAPAEDTAVTPDVDLNEVLANTNWDLVSYGGKTPLPNSLITLNFHADGAGGSAGCNLYFIGSYSLEGNAFTAREVGSTMMYCEETSNQEQAYLGMLQTADTLTLVGDVLTISTAEGDLIFQPAQHATLEETAWVLGGLAQPETEAVVSTMFDEAITAVFAEGQMTGYTGCNQYFAGYTAGEDGSLSLSGIGSTKRACLDDGTGQREAEFIKALEGVVGYTIQRDTLSLLNEAGQMVVTFNVAR
jgi:heat shock protein HslJ